MSEWQPIETAPRETEVLGLCTGFPGGTGSIYIVCFSDGMWWHQGYEGSINSLTHWMSLPARPDEAEESRKFERICSCGLRINPPKQGDPGF